MGQFPVISVSLKGGEGRSFEIAKEALKRVIGDEARRFSFLSNSEKLVRKRQGGLMSGLLKYSRENWKMGGILCNVGKMCWCQAF